MFTNKASGAATAKPMRQTSAAELDSVMRMTKDNGSSDGEVPSSILIMLAYTSW